ncbi:ZIP family metal transporter [Flavobacterium sp. NST-5]|uniref:ZIP family metal transporter n=2 Tax=Flavobacterium ichthyis TaxID=2698827 RepID=A0ABW9ZFW4_9FLAO|nr:ZIP family metal transporter [Flavobacterium ichthyis]
MHLLPEVYESANNHGLETQIAESHTPEIHDHNHTNHNHHDQVAHEHHDHEHHHPSGKIGIYIMLGILFQIILEFFSKGAEHGHVHGHHEMTKMPWLLFLSLCIHALLEGFPVSHHNDLALGIAIHHLPIAVILTSFFLNAKLNKTAIFFFMITFAFMTPLGTFASEFSPQLEQYYTEISAVVIGILFHISSTIIFESSENHKFNFAKLAMIAIGIVSAYFLS